MLTELRLAAETFKKIDRRTPGKAQINTTNALSLTRLQVLDSIDGRLLDAGIVLMWQPTLGRAGHLTARRAETGERLVLLPLKSEPQTPDDLPPTLLAGAVHKALAGRALVSLHQLKVQSKAVDVSVKGRIVADGLCASTGEKDGAWMWLDLRRGFESTALDNLKALGKPQANATQFFALVKNARKTAHLNSKGFPALKADMTAKQAIKLLHETLLAQMMSQVEGATKDIDIEFLHDLRVASRRARSLLQTVKSVLSEDVNAYGLERYRWIGQETTTLRDLDVYLHDYPALEKTLSPEMRVALEPFRTLLIAERKRALRHVKSLLASRAFAQFTSGWAKQLSSKDSYAGIHADKTIGAIAAKAILKRYQRICDDGNAITDDSPAEDLHDLRKQGKKLRYLLEFFASLYPNDQIKPRIVSLKKLQDLLGTFQDCSVQAAFLEEKATKLRRDVSVPAETLMAMGALADQRLQDEKRLRAEFRAFFKPFASAGERSGYKAMLKQ